MAVTAWLRFSSSDLLNQIHKVGELKVETTFIPCAFPSSYIVGSAVTKTKLYFTLACDGPPGSE